MWTKIKALFGWVDDEVHHVVAEFQTAINRLENIVTRKREVADQKAAEAAKAQADAQAATDAAAKAAAISGKLSTLISA